MTLNPPDLTELQSLLRFSVLCKYSVYDRKVLQKQVNICSLYQLKRQEWAAVNPFPVKKQDMNCSEQWDTESAQETLQEMNQQSWQCRGIAVLCKQREHNKIWLHSSWGLSELLLGQGAGQDLARKSFWNLGERNTQVLFVQVLIWKTNNLKNLTSP